MMADNPVFSPPYSVWSRKYDALNENDMKTLVGFLTDAIIGHFPYQERVSVLDLGCGTGELLVRFGDLVNSASSGVDISKDMIAVARTKLTAAKFVVGDMLTYADDHKYDVILSTSDALNYLPPETHATFLLRIKAHCHRQTLTYLDFDTAHDIEDNWDGQEHNYHNETLHLTRKFSYDPIAGVGTEVQTWRFSECSYTGVKKEIHRLYPIHLSDFSKKAGSAGFADIFFVDPSSGKGEPKPEQALRLGVFLKF